MLLSKAGLLFAFYSRTLLIIKCEGPRTAIAKLEAHGQYVLSSDTAVSKERNSILSFCTCFGSSLDMPCSSSILPNGALQDFELAST